MIKQNDKDQSSVYSWNDSMILDKIQEILEGKDIDELEFTTEELKNIKSQLFESISDEDLSECACILANSIDELKPLDDEEIKEYILRLKNYLNNTSIKFIKAEYKGIEFDIHKESSVDDIFNDFYSKYDSIYGISDMLVDLGLKF